MALGPVSDPEGLGLIAAAGALGQNDVTYAGQLAADKVLVCR